MEFENKLTKEEISRGLLTYIVRGLWPIHLLAALWLIHLFAVVSILVLLWWQHELVESCTKAVLLSFIVVTIVLPLSVGVCYALLRGNFSPDKTAIYSLRDDGLHIRSSNGHTHCYPYCEIKAVSSGDVFVLFFPGRSFAIVSKRRMNNELRMLFEESINF